MDYEPKKSADGTYTLYSKKFDECYHSLRDGAFSEAYFKHVKPVFDLVKKDELKILDICFGLGINTLTTIYHFQRQNSVKSLKIFSPEFDKELLKKLPSFNYPSYLSGYRNIIKSLVNEHRYEDEKIKIELFVGDAREYVKGLEDIDAVYQDAFSPKKNPTLWSVEYFKDIYMLLNSSGVLTTYSIAAPVRLGLYEAGFNVYEKEIEGIKKITIASKTELPLKKIDMQMKRKRSSSSPIWDKDISF